MGIPVSSTRHQLFPVAKASEIMIKNGKFNFRVPLGDILYIQAEHVYVRIHLRNHQSILYRSSLTQVWQELQGRHFLRIHRGYLVNLRAVTYFTTNYVMIGDEKFTIGRTYRNQVVEELSRWNGG